MSAFEDVITQDKIEIYGTSEINHCKRHTMGLTMAEYCVADFIQYANSKRKPITYPYVFVHLALDKEQFNSLSASLIQKGFVEVRNNELYVTRKWLDQFMVSEEWFDAFWFYKGKPFWPGSKKDAQAKFVKACKMYSPEFLIECRDRYLEFMRHPLNATRQLMGASVFLNLQTERFKEDWLGQLRRLKNPFEKVPKNDIKKIDFTKDAVEQLFQG